MLLTEFDEKKFIRTIQAEERENTLREKMRADEEKARADTAEAERDREKLRADSIQKEYAQLKEELEKYKKLK